MQNLATRRDAALRLTRNWALMQGRARTAARLSSISAGLRRDVNGSLHTNSTLRRIRDLRAVVARAIRGRDVGKLSAILLSEPAIVLKSVVTVDTLLLAMRQNSEPLVRLLLDASTRRKLGLDVNVLVPSEYGRAPLIVAAAENYELDIGIFRALLEYPGLDVNAANGDGETALMIAAYEGFLDKLRLLLSHPRINVNQGDDYGATPLYKVVTSSVREYRDNVNTQKNVVKLLIGTRGININGNDEYNPLLQAIENRNSPIALLLLADKRTDVNVYSYIGYTPLMLEIRNIGYDDDITDVFRAIVNHPTFKVNARPEQKTALMLAASNGNARAVSALLRIPGINANITTHEAGPQWGETALHMAAREGHVDVINLLLKVPGIRVNQRTASGHTPLMKAVLSGKIGAIKALIAAPGLKPNLREGEGGLSIPLEPKNPNSNFSDIFTGDTALMMAVRDNRGVFEREGVVKALLQAPGLDLNLKDWDDKTAYEIATKKRFAPISKAIREHVAKTSKPGAAQKRKRTNA